MKRSPHRFALLIAMLCGVAMSASDVERRPGLHDYAYFERPVFPAMLHLIGVVSGTVTVAVTWDDRGQVLDCFPIKASHPQFARAAVEAVEKWRLAPARIRDLQWRSEKLKIEFKPDGLAMSVGTEMDKLDQMRREARMRDEAAVDELDELPKPLNRVMPAYPVSRTSETGSVAVIVEFYMDEKGRVRAPGVKGDPEAAFAEEAVRAMTRWRFSPPKIDGRPVVAADVWMFEFGPRSRGTGD